MRTSSSGAKFPGGPRRRVVLKEGINDSLGILELINRLEEQFGQPLQFADLDPEKLTKVGPLSRHLAAQFQG
jgi:acyl carrier protein